MQLEHKRNVLQKKQRTDSPVAKQIEEISNQPALFAREPTGFACLGQVLARKSSHDKFCPARDRAELANVGVNSHSGELCLQYRLRLRLDFAQKRCLMTCLVQP